MIRLISALLLAFALIAGSGSQGVFASCGDGERCDVAEGYYLSSPPADWDGFSPLPLVVYFHGWNSSPEATFRNKAMVRGVNRRGALFVAPYAPHGYWRQIGEGRAENGRDELAYTERVMADIRRRWPIDGTRTMASGFSRGASMVWNVACYAKGMFRAYVPIAGGFWNSNPEVCPGGPVNLRHIHGTADRVVAYDAIGTYNSMPVTAGIDGVVSLNRCAQTPSGEEIGKRYKCRVWSGCASGREVQLCLHDGGHSIPAEWVGEGLDWMFRLAAE
ncbi:alpha/beta hydrolase family esterase [Nisaea nitritireducens]|uniref:alpha/beta hydrolase family esterase n=1 Tax=Nisaea nitritireducens TaxID=568392 RepID=UPI0018661848|nr:hypothetical protein [Nisaea nitritireducens]